MCVCTMCVSEQGLRVVTTMIQQVEGAEVGEGLQPKMKRDKKKNNNYMKQLVW